MYAEPGYLMLMLAPKHEVQSSEILPKDVVFVVDTSGSMQGLIDAARARIWDVVNDLATATPTPRTPECSRTTR